MNFNSILSTAKILIKWQGQSLVLPEIVAIDLEALTLEKDVEPGDLAPPVILLSVKVGRKWSDFHFTKLSWGPRGSNKKAFLTMNLDAAEQSELKKTLELGLSV